MMTLTDIADDFLSSLQGRERAEDKKVEGPPPAPARWTSDHLEFDTSGDSIKVSIRPPYAGGCAACHAGDGWIVDRETRTASRCSACLPVRKRVHRWNYAELPAKFFRRPFDRDGVHPAVMASADMWLDSFIAGGCDSLVLTGAPGVGKSFLAYDLARRILSRRMPVKWVRWNQLLSTIRSSYGSDSSYNEREIWAEVLGSKGVVIVDDFGDGSGTDWAKAQATHMLECLPTELRLVVTTNASIDGSSGIHIDDALGIRAASRLCGITGGGRFMVNVKGKDWRRC